MKPEKPLKSRGSNVQKMNKIAVFYAQKKYYLIAMAIVLPFFIYAYDPTVGCEPEWRFFGWSRSICGLDGGSQGVSHSHLPDNSHCVYYYDEYKYFFGFQVEHRIAQVTQPCPENE